MLTPEIKTMPGFTVAGMRYRGKNENEEVPELWTRFWSRHGEIQDRILPGKAYGVLNNFDPKTEEFDYIAGVAVSDDSSLPADMVSIWLPEQSYAVFRCTLPTLMETMQAIYHDWLPESEFDRAAGPEYEFYGEEFNPDQDQMTMYMFVPVVKK